MSDKTPAWHWMKGQGQTLKIDERVAYADAHYNPVKVPWKLSNIAWKRLEEFEQIQGEDWFSVMDTFYFTNEDQAVMFRLISSDITEDE